ncbi:hypothetical protein HDU98_009705 [Podochytrium sp. JEL0797]|nr:hypothetical protein HDU98_009705 [Podochytrium sp. JEL0797]
MPPSSLHDAFPPALPACPVGHAGPAHFSLVFVCVLCVSAGLVIATSLDGLRVLHLSLAHVSVRNWPFAAVFFTAGLAFCIDATSPKLAFLSVFLRSFALLFLLFAVKFHRAKSRLSAPNSDRRSLQSDAEETDSLLEQDAFAQNQFEFRQFKNVILLVREDDSLPFAPFWESILLALALWFAEVALLVLAFSLRHSQHDILHNRSYSAAANHFETAILILRLIRTIPVYTINHSLLHPHIRLFSFASTNFPRLPTINEPESEPTIIRRSISIHSSLRSPTHSFQSVDVFYDAREPSASPTPSVLSAALEYNTNLVYFSHFGIPMLCLFVLMEPSGLVRFVELFVARDSRFTCFGPLSIEDLVLCVGALGAGLGILNGLWKEFEDVKNVWVRIGVERVRDTFF